jgi:hypothetical protein
MNGQFEKNGPDTYAYAAHMALLWPCSPYKSYTKGCFLCAKRLPPAPFHILILNMAMWWCEKIKANFQPIPSIWKALESIAWSAALESRLPTFQCLL